MKKFVYTGGISLASILATLIIANLGSPMVQGLVGIMNPPKEVLSTRAQQIADSLEDGQGWQANGDELVHQATGMKLQIVKKDDRDNGVLKVSYTMQTAIQPKYLLSDLRLLRPYFDKRLTKIEDEYEANRLEGLRRPGRSAAPLDSKGKASAVPPGPRIDEPEQIPAPNNK